MLNQSDVNAPSGVEFSSISRLDKLVAPVLSTTLIATPLLRSTESMEETAEASGDNPTEKVAIMPNTIAEKPNLQRFLIKLIMLLIVPPPGTKSQAAGCCKIYNSSVRFCQSSSVRSAGRTSTERPNFSRADLSESAE